MSSSNQNKAASPSSSSSRAVAAAATTGAAGAGAEHPLHGRVVRLHFSCRAELPMGSFLRVTGSSLWAPGTPAFDQSEAATSVGRTEQTAFPVTESSDVENNAQFQNMANLYTSSIEMVTTPDMYPMWRTRRPVVVVLNRHAAHNKAVQHHYYRYLVVSPGAAQSDSASSMTILGGSSIVSTSNEFSGSTVVMQWEDPFGRISSSGTPASNQNTNDNNSNKAQTSAMKSPNVSTVSLTSVHLAASGQTRADYWNLPYRTLDIDVNTAQVTDVIYDNWNSSDDATLQPYLIREALTEENRRKMTPQLSNISDRSAGIEKMDTTEDDDDDDNNNKMDTTMEEEEAVPVVLPPRPKEPQRVGTSSSAVSGGGLSSGGGTTPPAFSPTNRIFFVCFHLPVVVVKNQSTGEWQASWSESILAKTEGSQILSTYDAFWLGTVTAHPPIDNEQDRDKVNAILHDMKCIPIYLDPAVRQSHYYGFCKQVLWPAMHNIDLLDLSTCGWLSDPKSVASDWDQSRLDDWWNAFTAVNLEFKTRVMGMIRAGDIVWIHDYHLCLLPHQLTTAEMEKYGFKMTRKVFFSHIPFPTSQVFRELECGEQILTGMLHADVVGFHAFDHARHFLNAAKRILGLNYESLVGGLIGVNFLGSTVLVSMSNVSIEPRMIDAAQKLPSVTLGYEELKRKHGRRTIIVGLDIGQRLSGVSLKLLAYERLLQDYPSWKKRVVMVERLLIPGSRKADEELTLREVRILAKRIQEKFGEAVIDYQEVIGTSLPMDQRLALWKAGDILMGTPVREGLNHWPMEFIYTHREPFNPGIVITSEFSATSTILNGALRVNPYDIQATITTIDKALSMDQQEREGRRYRDIGFVSKSQSDKWVKNVLRDLRDATEARNPSGSQSNSQVGTPYATPNPSRKMPADNTATFLAREANQSFSHLHIKDVQKSYMSSKRRVIVLDFNGTIVMKEPPGKYLKREILGTSGNKPPPDVIDALARLCADPKNTVYVVSGDSSENVISALGHVPRLGLAVSNGACFSPPVANPATERRRWLTFDLGVDWDAVKKVALPVLSKYTARSNGSFVKLTSFSIGWSYYSCDPEWGSLQAAHLVLELENELRAFDVRFVTLKGIVEVVPRKLNKGLIVKKVLHDTTLRQDLEGEAVDFVLCFGDDISDEKMFTSVFTFIADLGDESCTRHGPPVFDESGQIVAEPANQVSKVPDPMYSFTVAVGKKATHASTYVNDSQEVANGLVLLARGEIPQGGVSLYGRGDSLHMFD